MEARVSATVGDARWEFDHRWALAAALCPARARITLRCSLGAMPLMVRSSKCPLSGLSPAQLVAKKEEAEEMGGYFVVNGNEKCGPAAAAFGRAG